MFEVPPGSTGRSINLKLRDSGTAQSKTGLTASSPGAAITYTRHQQNAVSIPLVALSTPSSPWTAGGFIGTGAVGEYRLDLPDASLAAGVPWVTVNSVFDLTFDDGVLVLLRNPTNNVGAGGTPYQVTVQKADTTPIAGAQVWVSTDIGMANVIAGPLTTDALGLATFQLDTGSYYLWQLYPGYNGPNPTPFTVT